MKTWNVLPLTLMLLTACAPYRVRYDFDTQREFASYKTYEWSAAPRFSKAEEPAKESEPNHNPIMDRRVAAAVEKALAARGFQHEATGNPDFLVVYHPTYQEKTVYHGTHLGWGTWGMRRWGFGLGTTVGRQEKYQEGTLVLEILDFKSGQLIWKAAAEGALTEGRSPESADRVVAEAVKKLLENFPPKKPQ